jgi:DNA-binding transcriptional ArsR family regulator
MDVEMKVEHFSWKHGTAYDLFVSLHVLHEPEHFGIRPAWVAGVRSRLSAQDRETLKQAESTIWPPFHWVKDLPEPQDISAVLWGLRQIQPKEILPTLGIRPSFPEGAADIYLDVASRGTWDAGVLDALRATYQSSKSPPRPKLLESRLNVWAEAESFGSRFPAALRAYREVFYSEEEKRIIQAIDTAIAYAQSRSAQIPLEDLIEELSHGVRLERSIDFNELVMVPSYWITPLVVFEHLSENQGLFLFGARPMDVSLVPGDLVPDGMLRMIKTLGDPTRLRILRYLSQESVKPAELARRLRLRPPTVTHHLNLLRLAGLVYLTLEEGGGKRYQARSQAVDEAFCLLKSFLGTNNENQPC